jgi:hypothetical protein
MTEYKDNRNRLTLSTHLLGDKEAKDQWVSQAEASRIRHVSRQAIARLVKKRRFRTLTVGGRVFVHREDVEAFKAAHPGRPRDDRKNRRAKKAN